MEPTRNKPLVAERQAFAGMGDGKEKRKIPVICLQVIDLPITDDPALRGDSKLFPTAFLGISPMESMILIVQDVYKK